MPTLFVANATKQNHDFLYRVPGDDRVHMQQIKSGEQIRVHQADAPVDVLSGIVQQHERYGMVDARNIDMTRGFVGLCFSIDKPVEVEKILRADENNTDVLIEQGHEQRKEAALALNAQMEANGPGLQSLEVQVTEEAKRGDLSPKMQETIAVARDDAGERRGPGRPRKNG